MTQTRKPVLLIIRDGWGANHNPEHAAFDAVSLARKPCDDRLRAKYPVTEVAACGLDVGLPEGVMGNSEVGHQNIGAGRIVDQEVVRISKAFRDGKMKDNPVLREILGNVTSKGGRLHLMGIVSDAGVHGLLEHLYGLLREAKAAGIGEVFIHAFTDGRDTSPRSGAGYLRQIEEQCGEIGIGKIAGVYGRYWSMDRDNRWDRVERAYNALTGKAADRTARSAIEAVEHYYENPIDSDRKGDEFVTPCWIVDDEGKPVGTIADGDSVIFYNYRGDRPRELCKAFVLPEFDGFERGRQLDLSFGTMTEYEKGLPVKVLFTKPEKMKNILGMYLSEKKISQFRCAETEKYPHVTFFFNDYREEPFSLEDRKMAQSPKVSTYDQKPEMSAYEITEAAKDAILSGKYGFLLVNFANPDMVGHTGVLEATIKAVETVDSCVDVLLKALESAGGKAIVTADHGNADQMFDPASNGPHTSHTLNPVELFVVGDGCENLVLREGGRLGDIAPTLLELMELPAPDEMTGSSLIERR